MGAPEDRAAPDAHDSPEPPEQPAEASQPSRSAERPGKSAQPVDPRPRPAYGEYAPEGWEWKPESEDEPAGAGSAPDPASASSIPVSTRAGAGPVAGVPHNLGVRNAPQPSAVSQSAPRGTAAEAPGPRGDAAAGRRGDEPAPYRADSPQPLPPGQARAAAAAAAGAPTPKNRRGDRVVTIILLVLGGLGALYNALSLMQLPASLELILTAMGGDAAIPGWIGTMSTISAIAMLALYAVTLIYSLQRLRAGRLAFFVPLSAGAIALVLLVGVSVAAMFGIPEFMELSQDPDAVNRMMRGLLETNG